MEEMWNLPRYSSMFLTYSGKAYAPFLCNFMGLELRKTQQIAHDHFARISLEHEKATRQLQAKREELGQREK